MRAVRRLLVTGFGPFPGCPVNPTAWLAEDAGRALGVEWRVLPVTWDVPARLAEQVADFDGVVALGVARGRRAVEVERLAYNAAAADNADAAGVAGSGAALAPGAPDVLEGVLHRPPFGAVVEAARAGGLPVGYSDDAGRYLCNALFFHLLRAAGDGGRPVGFVHVPHLRGLSTDDPDALAPEDAAAAVRHLVAGWFGRPSRDAA
jgi:pyroglutamyl-peptidase